MPSGMVLSRILVAPVHASNQELSWLRSDQVLIVDDDPDLVESIAGVLRTIGCTCHTAESCTDAAKLLADRSSITIAIVDAGATRGALAASIAILRKARSGLTLIGTSGADSHAAFESVGVFKYLAKPWGVDDLIELLT